MICQVAVIARGRDDLEYENFRKGMDQAAREFDVDVHFLTLYEENDWDDQKRLVEQEVQDGADAVIVDAVWADPVGERFRAISPGTPTIVIRQQVEADYPIFGICADYEAAGRTLGTQVASEIDGERPVWLVCRGTEFGSVSQVLDSLLASFLETSITPKIWDQSKDGDLETFFSQTAGERPCVIALDLASLWELSGRIEYPGQIALYGIGSTTAILNRIDSGLIRGVMAYSAYDEGYLAVREAVWASQGMNMENLTKLDVHYITKEQLDDRTFERMLYPMD